jgi:hypothetical protein
LQGKPNSHAWNTKGSFQSNRLPFIPTRGSDPPQATAGPYALLKCRTYICSVTTKPVFLVALATRIPQSNQVTRRTNTCGGRYVHSSSRLVTRLTAYHISRYVVSTFKHLTPIDTHRDLNQFINTDGVAFLSIILQITPSVILIVITGI